MPGKWKSTLAGGLVLMPLLALGQSRPSFSGEWVLVSATATGVRGSGEAASGDVPIKSNTASGAAFNCGRECTIVHKGQALTIDRALLGSDPKHAPAVTLQLNGRETSVLDSFTPSGTILVTAEWNGNRLEIMSRRAAVTTTQIVSIEASELVVVTSTASIETEGPRVTLKYKKRSAG